MKRLLSVVALVTIMVACNNAEDNNEYDNTSLPDSTIVDTVPVGPAPGTVDSSATMPDTARAKMNRAIKK